MTFFQSTSQPNDDFQQRLALKRINTEEQKKFEEPQITQLCEEISKLKVNRDNIDKRLAQIEKEIQKLHQEEKDLEEEKAKIESEIDQLENPRLEIQNDYWKYYPCCFDSQNLNSLFTAESLKIHNEFEEPDNEKNLIYSEKKDGQIKYISLPKLIQKLTQDSNQDMIKTFLLTYKTYIQGEDLLNMLILRFNTPPPKKDLKPEEFEVFLRKKLLPIRTGVNHILTRWISTHYSDFREDKELRENALSFIRQFIKVDMQTEGQLLSKILMSQMHRTRNTFEEQKFKKILNNEKPIKQTKHFLDAFTPEDIADTITVMEFETFQMLQPKEFLNQNWGKDRQVKAPNIYAMVERSNHITHMVINEILKKTNLKERAALLTKFIKMCIRASLINSYNLLFELVMGLTSNPIFRLKKTWDLVPKKYLDEYNKLKEFSSQLSNYKYLREALEKVIPPCIPYIGVFLSDLTFIEDGNKNEKNGLLHFSKCMLLAEVIRKIQYFQNTSYFVTPKSEIRNSINELKPEMEQDVLYELSLKLEPRQ